MRNLSLFVSIVQFSPNIESSHMADKTIRIPLSTIFKFSLFLCFDGIERENRFP